MTTRYATTPCRGCGKQIVFVTTAGGKTVPLDPVAPVYVREADGEGGAVWAKDGGGDIMVSHFATCSRANDFSAGKRKP
jgi:hypothetical protein